MTYQFSEIAGKKKSLSATLSLIKAEEEVNMIIVKKKKCFNYSKLGTYRQTYITKALGWVHIVICSFLFLYLWCVGDVTNDCDWKQKETVTLICFFTFVLSFKLIYHSFWICLCLSVLMSVSTMINQMLILNDSKKKKKIKKSPWCRYRFEDISMTVKTIKTSSFL